MRLDAALVERGLARSRERAQGLIESGLVTVNGQIAKKNALSVTDADAITVTGDDLPWVSRGALKLIYALDAFHVDPGGAVCVDIGASTGGFTQVLLSRGARKVYAVDVGTSQLADALRGDPRVVVMEQTNARTLHRGMFDPAPAIAVMDVSFISIKLILPAALDLLDGEGRMLTLIKPQFEAGRGALNKPGVVTRGRDRERVIEDIRAFTETLNWRVEGVVPSPILGGSGNHEYLASLVRNHKS